MFKGKYMFKPSRLEEDKSVVVLGEKPEGALVWRFVEKEENSNSIIMALEVYAVKKHSLGWSVRAYTLFRFKAGDKVIWTRIKYDSGIISERELNSRYAVDACLSNIYFMWGWYSILDLHLRCFQKELEAYGVSVAEIKKNA
ncbi:MAG: hypothetical protein Q6363_008125 [Candidatus Njordarchaeota archaeon]